MRLIEIQPILQNILNVLRTTMDIEGSIIDNEYNLLAYTENYLKYKGSDVHSPFIKKVFEVGEIIVSKPGEMPICKGCRFQEKCPAKIEILHSIQFEGIPVGSLSISSFNNADSCLIDKSIKAYKKAVFDTTLLIESLLKQHSKIEKIPFYRELLRTMINHSNESILCVNQQGKVIDFNQQAKLLFNNVDLIDERISDILPENRFTKLLNNKFNGKNLTHINKNKYYVSSKPIIWDQVFQGAIISLTPDVEHEKRINHPSYFIEFDLDYIIGNSPIILDLKEKIRQISNKDSSVLIIGETGTGKELIARGIHTSSTRSEYPFVAVNCAAIPETLLESEFFGYDEGAFTGARRSGKTGLIEVANGGTLFLDEIGDMPISLQAKLLRVLQNGEIRRIGGEKSTKINVRIISATNQDLLKLSEEGLFRKDLYYRLDVIKLKTPSLRERKEDISLIAQFFLDQYNDRYTHHIDGFEEETLAALRQYYWPGNVRELENVIEYAINFEPTSKISLKTISDKIDLVVSINELSLKDKIDQFEKNLIENALVEYGNDVNGKRKVAEELHIGLRTLYRKLESLGIT